MMLPIEADGTAEDAYCEGDPTVEEFFEHIDEVVELQNSFDQIAELETGEQRVAAARELFGGPR
jgi:hypothetical protein